MTPMEAATALVGFFVLVEALALGIQALLRLFTAVAR